MADNEKALIEAAAVIHEINPGYASAFLDGVAVALKAFGPAEEGNHEKDEHGAGSD